MKFSLPLNKHNLYRLMRNHWKVARKRRIVDTRAQEVLEGHNLDVVEANDFVAPVKEKFDFSTIVGLAPHPIPKDENHPLYKEQPCYMFKDHSVLLEGLHQALALTNTVQMQSNCLPVEIDNLIESVQLPNQDELVQRCIRTSCLYDAEQKKLPVKKDPTRPAWNFPRDFGITDSRKNRMLCNRLLHLCGLACPNLSADRGVLHNVLLSVPLQWDEDQVFLQLRTDVFITSNTPLRPLVDPSQADGHHLPGLSVSHPLISLEEENFYELKDLFPLKENSRFSNVHTIMVHYNNDEVKNIFDSPVTESQVLGRSLMKAFTAAVAQARYNHGTTVKDLEEPVVVQCVQTDGKIFHFSVLQLNSVDVQSSRRNVFWSIAPLSLYDNCLYQKAVPILDGYNPDVFKTLLAFYVNKS